MSGTPVDLANWDRAAQFQLFRTYDRPHYATTVRVDVTRLMTTGKTQGLSPFRHAIWAIGVGLHAVPELCMRFKDDTVTRYDRLLLSATIPLQNGDFRYSYFRFDEDRAAFDAETKDAIATIKAGGGLDANDGTIEDVAYLSCLPWLDYTSLNNALPHADDCIPRISWGKITPKGDGFDMTMTLEVHHALADGRHVAQFFDATRDALAAFP